MKTIIDFFLYPTSPILAMIASGSLLVGVECIPGLKLPRAKYLLAILGAVASIVMCVTLLRAFPSAFSTVGLSEGEPWLVQFTKSYRLDFASVALFLAIAVFTLFALVFIELQFRLSEVRTEIFALVLFIASGMMVLVSADSLLMVFLGLELLSLPTYVLVGIRRNDRNSCEAALKYFLFGSFATVLLVFGIGLVYAQFGTLSIPKISQETVRLAGNPAADLRLALAGLALLVIAIGFKVGLAPFHMWVPDTYQGAPTSITGFMGSAIKLAGFGLAVRVFWGMSLPLAERWSHTLGILAVVTMFIGNIAALAQDNLKRMFAYSSISHAGFLMLGVSAVTRLPAASTVPHSLDHLYYYLVVYGLMFLGLFGALALVERQTKSTEIFQLSGLGFSHPVLGLCIALFTLSGAGIPPTAGFFAKYFVFLDAVRAGQTVWVVLALIASLIGVYYYLRVIVYLYMKETKDRLTLTPVPITAFACIIVCAVALLYFAVMPHVLAITDGLH